MTVRFSTPLHPGEVLREEYLTPLSLSAGKLAKALGVPRTRVERIVREEIGITADTALRLAKYFDTTPNLWLNLQQSYELAVSMDQLREDLAAIQPARHGNDNEAAKRKRA